MITEQLLLKAALSFLVGGFYITIMTIIAERFGSKIGGLLIALPGTALIGLLFIAGTSGPDAMVEATTIMPAVLAAIVVFLAAFVFFNRFGLIFAYLSAIAVWFALSISLIALNLNQILLSAILGLVFLMVGLGYLRKLPHRKLPTFHLTVLIFVARYVFVGSVVALAVLLAGLLGPLWGGMFSSFPAAFSVTLLILAKAHGIDFTASVAKAMAFGVTANIVFVIGVFYLVPSAGVAVGTILAYLICLAYAAGMYRFILNRI